MRRFIWSDRLLIVNLLLVLILKTSFSYLSMPLAEITQTLSFGRADVIKETNSLRSSLGFSTLSENQTLNEVARQRLSDMQTGGYFSHVSPTGVQPWYWFTQDGYRYLYAGENLAIGFYDVKAVIQAWQQSPTHRANILSKDFKEIGVAVAPTTIGGHQGMLVVQIFGTPLPGLVEAISSTPTPLTTPLVSTPFSTKIVTLNIQSTKTIDLSEPAPFARIIPQTAPIVDIPLSVQVAPDQSPIYRISHMFDTAFSAYALGIALIGLFVLVYFDRQRNVAWRAALHLFIFALAVAVPMLSLVSGLII